MNKKNFPCFLMIISYLTIYAFCYSLFENADSSYEKSIISNNQNNLNKVITDKDRIIVTLKNEKTISDKIYTKKDFRGLDVASIRELTSHYGVSCRKLLSITLKKTQKWDKILNILSKNRFVYDAEIDAPLSCASSSDFDSSISGNYWWLEKIQADNAWAISDGSSNINVAVLDTGIDSNHNDLDGNINTMIDECFSPDYTTSLADAHGHGTHVSGIIGAESNGFGSNGICKNVSIVSYRVCDTGVGANNIWYTSAVIQSLNDAAYKNIDLVNFSGQHFSNTTALEAAFQGFPGLIVCCAGNDGEDTDSHPNYPSCFELDNIISVGNSNQNDERCTAANCSSNYGNNSVDLFAPGESIYSTLPNNTYGAATGTSMATPQVTGTIALMKSINPNLTNAQLKSILLENVDSSTFLNGICVSGGRLNTYKSLRAAIPSHNSTSTFSSVQAIDNNSFQWHKINCDYGEYVFHYSGSLSLSAELYSDILGVPIASSVPSGTNGFDISVSTTPFGTYYLKIINNGLSSGSYTIVPSNLHQHNYSSGYTWKNSRKHYAFCSCGDSITQGHAVSSNDLTTCLLCHGYVDMGIIGPMSNFDFTLVGHGSKLFDNGLLIVSEYDLALLRAGQISINDLFSEANER